MRILSALVAFPAWVLLGTATSIGRASEVNNGAPAARADDFLPGPSAEGCDEVWRTWPNVQRNAVASGTVMVFDLVSRVGNAFMDLRNVIEVSERRWTAGWRRVEQDLSMRCS